MELRVGDYIIASDDTCVTLFRVGVSGEKSKNPGRETRRALGYFGNLDVALSRLLNHRLLASDATTVERLLAELRATESRVLAAVGAAPGQAAEPEEIDPFS